MTTQIDPSEFDPRRAVAVRGLVAAYPFLTGAAARAYILRAEPHLNSRGETVSGNGLAGAIRRIGGKGGKVLIDPVLFGEWLRMQPSPNGIERYHLTRKRRPFSERQTVLARSL